MNSCWTRIARVVVLGMLGTIPLRMEAQAPAAPEPEPLTLRHAVELAVARAPGLAGARAASEEGAASADLARDEAYHPAAYFSTTPGYTYGLPTLVVGQVPSIFALEIVQPIYDPVRRSAALRAQASASSLGASLALSCRATMESTVAAYGRAYLDGVRVEAGRRR